MKINNAYYDLQYYIISILYIYLTSSRLLHSGFHFLLFDSGKQLSVGLFLMLISITNIVVTNFTPISAVVRLQFQVDTHSVTFQL